MKDKQVTAFLSAALLIGVPSWVMAQTTVGLTSCAQIKNDAARLKCYDHFMQSFSVIAKEKENNQPPTPKKDQLAQVAKSLDNSPLQKRWAIDQGKSGLLIRPHEPMYLLLARHTNRPDLVPGLSSQPEDMRLDDTEIKYQLSMKFRLIDVPTEIYPDLWFGYTQQSQWQAYNRNASRPFRETNYAPEAMLVWHPDRAFGPLAWRLLNIGFMHQSNGRAGVLSRSWNRVYAQFGFDTDNLTLLVRPWIRLKESSDNDENPDVTDYLGHGDIVVSYKWRKHQFSGKLRGSVEKGKGYGELSWSYPFSNGIKVYLQATSGYGESLIDYNKNQTTFGAGVALYDW